MNPEILIADRVTLKTGNGGLRYLELKCNGAEAQVYLHGAHVLHYQPAGQAPVLWYSSQSQFKENTPIRGGIPICWPWFGPHPSDSTLPLHGFARLVEWEPVSSSASAEETGITLRYPGKQGIEASLELTVSLSDSLKVTLTTVNLGSAPMPLSDALHNYFGISDISNITITGLEDTQYADCTKAERPTLTQTGSIAFTGETNRIYVDTNSECIITDPGMKRRIRIAKDGSRSTVVWNPWKERALTIPDLGDDEYPLMVCVETANCGPNTLSLAPGQTHAITTDIRAESL